MKPAQVSTPDDTSVVVTRAFEAPVQLVWRAYTEADLFKQWCQGPPGWSMTVCEFDLRKGGQYRWRWRDENNGVEFGFYGEFLEVILKRKIVHTQIYDPGDMGIPMGSKPWTVTVEFQEAGGVTQATTTITFASKQDRDASVQTGMTDGMEMNYKRLDETLTAETGKP